MSTLSWALWRESSSFPMARKSSSDGLAPQGFGAPGIKSSLEQLTERDIPKFVAWLIIIRAVVRKYCAYIRLFKENRGRWTVHHLHRCAQSTCRMVDTELVWIKKWR